MDEPWGTAQPLRVTSIRDLLVARLVPGKPRSRSPSADTVHDRLHRRVDVSCLRDCDMHDDTLGFWRRADLRPSSALTAAWVAGVSCQ